MLSSSLFEVRILDAVFQFSIDAPQCSWQLSPDFWRSLTSLAKAIAPCIDIPDILCVQVQVENDNVLTISGERKRDEPTEDTKYLQLERPAGKFLRKFTLPQNADWNISAHSSDGVLTVTVPKLPPPEPHKPRTIDVTVG